MPRRSSHSQGVYHVCGTDPPPPYSPSAPPPPTRQSQNLKSMQKLCQWGCIVVGSVIVVIMVMFSFVVAIYNLFHVDHTAGKFQDLENNFLRPLQSELNSKDVAIDSLEQKVEQLQKKIDEQEKYLESFQSQLRRVASTKGIILATAMPVSASVSVLPNFGIVLIIYILKFLVF